MLDDWDPRVIDGIAAHHRVIAFDNRGVGATGSVVPDNIDQMADDAIAFIRALDLTKVDLIGFSLGGAVAQVVALKAPDLVLANDLGGHRTSRWRRNRRDAQNRRRRLHEGSPDAERPREYLFFSPHYGR